MIEGRLVCSPISWASPSLPGRRLRLLILKVPTSTSTSTASTLLRSTLSIPTNGAKLRSNRPTARSAIRSCLCDEAFSKVGNFHLWEGGFRWGGRMQGRSFPASLYSIKYLCKCSCWRRREERRNSHGKAELLLVKHPVPVAVRQRPNLGSQR